MKLGITELKYFNHIIERGFLVRILLNHVSFGLKRTLTFIILMLILFALIFIKWACRCLVVITIIIIIIIILRSGLVLRILTLLKGLLTLLILIRWFTILL